jgi:hypothetical protein
MSQAQWLMSVMPATQEVQIGKLQSEAGLATNFEN